MELKENYERLANAIIILAAKDYRRARKYLRKHPHTRELDGAVAAQAAKRREQEEKRRKRQGGKEAKAQPERKPTREERLLRKITNAEKMVSDVERFLLSDWYGALTDVDGETLLKRLRAE